MIDEFNDFININSLFDKTDRLLVTVSGGVDSVVMLHLCVISGYDVSVAHCNFGLRGEESDRDEIFVKKLSKKYDVPLFVKRCDAAKYARENKTSVQIAARRLRYGFFDNLVKQKGFTKVLTGHNAGDDVESFFINLSRGTGLKGLRGIPLKRGYYVRPLMFAQRVDIETYAEGNNLPWREDSSNASDKYLRNRIRHHLVPVLDEISEKFIPSIVKTMQNITEATLLFDNLLSEKRKYLLVKDNGNLKIDLKKMENEPDKEILLYYLLQEFGFNRDSAGNIYNSINEKSTGKIFLSENYRLLINRNELVIAPLQEKYSGVTTVESLPFELDFPLRLTFSLKKNRGLNFGKDRRKVWFDAEKIKMPLTLRAWQKGDSFKPFGMKGTKLVSDLLIDEKLSLFEKERVFVLISGEKIIWVVGVRPSDHFKVTDDTKEVLEIQFFKPE